MRDITALLERMGKTEMMITDNEEQKFQIPDCPSSLNISVHYKI